MLESRIFFRIAMPLTAALAIDGSAIAGTVSTGTLAASVSTGERSASPVVASDAFVCEGIPRAYRSGDLIIVNGADRGRGMPRVIYQIYDADGIWTYPETPAAAVLRVPAAVREPFVLATRPCAPGGALLPGGPPRPGIRIYEVAGHAANPVSCTQPFAVAHALSLAEPALPKIVRDQHRSGFVEVDVLLDGTGRVASAFVSSDSLPWLTGNAEAAARDTSYAPAVFRCEPVSSHARYRVDYTARPE